MQENTWTILKLVEWLTEYFAKKGIENPRLDAEYIIAHSLNIKRLDLYLQFDRPLSQKELDKTKTLITRRGNREPLQHILGHQPFRNVDIKVSRDVLIPRPETEILVGEILKIIPKDRETNILEIGLGSGAISAAILNETEKTHITAVDISSRAINLAKENLRTFKDRINIFEGNLFEPVEGRSFDIIVSNPPYCKTGEWESLQPEVRNFEPKEALLAGEDGLDFLREILNSAPKHLNKSGRLFMEFGDGQETALLKIANDSGNYSPVEIIYDLNNKPRIISTRIK